uniref:SNRNP25 ubiquitin-like domain-containing protein n=1 Tax=Solanum tuberosum TaxID=4113 RepID=M1CRW3_SOLTU
MVKIIACFQLQNRSSRVWTPFPLSKKLVRSFGYRKLPEQLLNISVLKLDGSSFVIHVARNATVADLKQAVEEAFNFSREDEGKILCSNAHEGNVEVNSNIDHQEKSKKNGDFQDEDAIPKPEFKRSHFLRRWLSQSTSWIPKKKALA